MSDTPVTAPRSRDPSEVQITSDGFCIQLVAKTRPWQGPPWLQPALGFGLLVCLDVVAVGGVGPGLAVASGLALTTAFIARVHRRETSTLVFDGARLHVKRPGTSPTTFRLGELYQARLERGQLVLAFFTGRGVAVPVHGVRAEVLDEVMQLLRRVVAVSRSRSVTREAWDQRKELLTTTRTIQSDEDGT
ncbi:MAG: hypothetical protein AAGA48_26855 [Myxococcota bacterium]